MKRITACKHLLACFGFMALGASAFAGDYPYKMVKIPAPNVAEFRTWRVNDLRHIAVYTYNADREGTGWQFWSPETGYVKVTMPDGRNIHVVDMNNHDQLLGWTGSYDDGVFAVIWTTSGVETFRPPPGYNHLFAERINDRGLVVGRVVEDGPHENELTPRGFHRTPAGEIVIDRPGAVSCNEEVDDQAGVVALSGVPTDYPYGCLCSIDDQNRAFLVRDGKRHEITIPGRSNVCVTGLNNAGQVTVQSYDGRTEIHGFWSKSTGTIPIDFTDSYMYLEGIMDGGIVVGSAPYPFLWERHKGPVRIADLFEDPPDNFYIEAFTLKGVLGGYTDRYPFVLVPRR